MISNELLEELQMLNRVDKLRVIQLLAGSLAESENEYLVSNASYQIWSPYNASAAANTLLQMLDEDQS